MKRLCLTLSLLVLSVAAASAQNVLWRLFESYSGQPGYTCVQLERNMMRMMSRHAQQQGDEELARMLDGIEAIRILVQREGSFEELDRELQLHLKRGFDAISTLDEAGQITRCYLRPEEKDWNGYAEFVMFSYGTRETVLLDIYGTFDVHSISRLTTIRPK